MLLPQKIGKAIGICGIILRDVLVDDPGQDRDAALMKCSESSTVPRLAAPMSPRRWIHRSVPWAFHRDHPRPFRLATDRLAAMNDVRW